MSAIAGTRRQYKEMADGTLRVSIDIDPQYKQEFLELFPGIDMPVALAPLKSDFEQAWKQSVEKTNEDLYGEKEGKGGPLSKSAAMQCQYPPFQRFAIEELRRLGKVWPVDVSKEQIARELILFFCSIKSRAELDHNAKAATLYSELMELYRKWNHG